MCSRSFVGVNGREDMNSLLSAPTMKHEHQLIMDENWEKIKPKGAKAPA
jgi:hypothetical protein